MRASWFPRPGSLSLAVVAALGVYAGASFALGQPPVTPVTPPATPVDTRVDPNTIRDRQQKAQDDYEKFEAKVLALAQKWEKGDDADRERAKGLRLALKTAQEKGVEGLFKDISGGLGTKSVDPTSEAFRTLLEKDADLTAALEKVLDDLRAEDELAKLKREIADIKALMKEVDRLKREQENIRARTDLPKGDPNKLAKDQAAVARDTKDLADRVARRTPQPDPKSKTPDAKGADGKDGDGNKSDPHKAEAKPGEDAAQPKPDADGAKSDPKGDGNPKPGDPKAADPKAGDPKEGGAETKPMPGGAMPPPAGDREASKDEAAGEPKPGSPKPAEPKVGDPKAGDPKAGDPKDGKSDPSDSKSQGEGKAVGKPSEGQQAGEGKPQAGESASQPKPPSKGSPGSPSSGGGPPKPPQPGQQGPPNPEQKPAGDKLDEAFPQQKGAADDLNQNKKEDAARKEELAIKKLDEALKELEKLLKQKRDKELIKLLTALEERIDVMIRLQKQVLVATRQIDDAVQKNMGQKSTLDIRRAADEADKEALIVAEAQKALDLIRGEGSAVAFGGLLAEVQKDMDAVRKRLGACYVAADTQQIETDIIDQLTQMKEALQKAKKDAQQSQSQPKPPGEPPPPGNKSLIDRLAELKLIRSMQVQVNTRTATSSKLHPGEQPTDPLVRDELKVLSDRQRVLQDMLHKIATGTGQ